MSIRVEFERLVKIAEGTGGAGTGVPCSRYGLTSGMCAVYAAAAHWLLRVHNGPFLPLEEQLNLDSLMSATVNDDATVAELIAAEWFTLPRVVREQIGQSRSYVRRLARGDEE